jgi:uncharacterized protein YyaL (SSP411 family)
VQKPSFSVVTLVVVVLGMIGLGLRQLATLLPPPAPNRMEVETADFLRQGSRHAINWRPLSDEAFSEARRTDRPVLLLLGSVWSTEARRMDQMIFTDSEVQSFLARNFICVRVDLDESPQWRTAFLPVSRVRTAISSGFQLYYLDPQGRLYDFYSRRGVRPLTDALVFLDEFVSARNRYEEVRRGDGGILPAGKLQTNDLDILEQAPSMFPNREYFLQELIDAIDPRHGGFARFGQSPRPLALSYLLAHGQIDSWRSATNAMLRSGIVDWLDGGFYRTAKSRDWTDIEFDKLALHNAELMQAIGMGGQMLNDAFCLRIAKNTFDALFDGFASEGWIVAARVGDDDRRGRSAYASFSVQELRRYGGTGLLTRDETDLARDFFGLTVEENPQMVMRVLDPAEFADPRFDPLIKKLRESRKARPAPYSKVPYANVNFGVVAAALHSARIWNDQERIARAERFLEQLEPFLSANDVTHRMPQQVGDRPLLPDYLNASEAFLEHYLATGRVDSLERGLAILRRARTLFVEDGEWLLAMHRSEGLGPEGTDVPEIIDMPTESATARVIRLLGMYGRLLRGGNYAPLARQFTEEALELSARYGSLVPDMGVTAAGIMSAASGVLDERHAIVVGEYAVDEARRLSSRLPTRFVAPAFGLVREDIQRRGAGVYVVEGGDVVGPLSVEEAVNRLPVFIDPARTPGSARG